MSILKQASFAVVIAVAALFAKQKLAPLPRGTHPAYEYRAMQAIWTPAEMEGLMRRIESFGSFPTTSRDVTTDVDNIGEAMEPTANGTCSHPLMVLSRDRTRCTLPHRFDVATHYLKSGGRGSFKDDLPHLIARMLSFPKFLHANMLTMLEGEFETLFNSSSYRKHVDVVCEGRPVVDPFQLGIIVQVPGQQVPTHYDAPWFWGASRFSLPQWLLVVMEQSKLWEDRRVRQIQGVAYVHNFTTETEYKASEINEKFGGGFFFFPEGPGGRSEVFEARPNAAIMLDGSVMVHGTEAFKIPGVEDVPLISKDAETELRFKGHGVWELVSDGEVLREYRTEHLRISLVWRGRCFKDEAEKDEFHKQLNEPQIPLQEVLDTLVADLRKRGRLAPQDPVPEPLDLALLLVEEYVRYPYGTGTIPFNYCIASAAVPFLEPLLRPFCNL